MKRLLLIVPPLTQLNTTYPSIAFLAGFLKKTKASGNLIIADLNVTQADLSLELALRLFSRDGLARVREGVEVSKKRSPALDFFLTQFLAYQDCVEPVIAFLQGRDPTLALRIVGRQYLPEGPRFEQLRDEAPAANEGTQDHAKHLASLFIDDLVDVIREGADPRFGFSRYAEKLAASQTSFDPLFNALEVGARAPTLVEQMMTAIARGTFDRHRPDLIGISVPFPGNVYGAFWIAREAKQWGSPLVILGGGYVNTELRELSDPRVFDFVDYVTLDDGERPLLGVLEGRPFRTFVREKGEVVFRAGEALGDIPRHDIPFQDLGTPCYEGLPLEKYFSLCESQNPMHRLWSDGRWNKLMVAHGCYWKKCNFCDVSLPYISRYDVQAPAENGDHLVDQMCELIKETGQSGFHFVDEAAPPAHLKALAERLVARRVQVTWWGNIRFEKTFTRELAQLLARSGCVAVTGGLEVASDRLLKVINKGVSVDQVARVTHAFSQAGVMVHAYLMYGVPGQTLLETVDALERVRQLFKAGCVQSAFWHRFSVTAHSPIGQAPARFGIELEKNPKRSRVFARNDLAFKDLKGLPGVDHDLLGVGLNRALYNFMQSAGLDEDVRMWFEPEFPRGVPRSKVAKGWIKNALNSRG
ncbi:radical SAM protein [Bdellovibrionota bacterium FG-2]